MAKKIIRPEASAADKVSAEAPASSVVVLGDLDALGNFSAFIDNKPAYVYRSPAGVWKSVNPTGRRRYKEKMSTLLEQLYQAKVKGLPTVENLIALQSNPEALQKLGAAALASWLGSTDNDAAPWIQLEANPLLIIQALRKALESALEQNR